MPRKTNTIIPLKILIVSSDHFFSSYGGGQVYVKNLVDELIRQKIRPIIASPGTIEDKDNIYNECKISTFNRFAAFDEIENLVKEIRPDIVHANGYKAYFARACVRLNIPCILTAHHGGILCPAGTLLNYRDEICHIRANSKDCLPCVLKNIRGGFYVWPVLRLIPLKFRLLLGRIINKLPFILYITPVLKASLSIQEKAEEWKTIYKNASLIIAPSYAIAKSMIRNGILPEKIKVVPHGIPLPAHTFFPEPKTNKENVIAPIRFFYVGRICHVKGVHVMLAAFDKLTGNGELHIIGGAGNKVEERYMRRLQNKYKHNKKIIWHGKVAHNLVNSMVKQYDVMIHPAICMEIFGLNIAEALALGKPVIATRCGGAEMQITDSVNGYLVEANNSVALAERIFYIIAHREEVQQLAINIRQPVSIGEYVEQLSQVYKEVAASKK